jgi:predicted ArsR family transcriptional regulator
MTESSADLSPDMHRFIEGMGRYFEQYQLPRIGGRILALLMIAEKPLSLDDMAARLLVSRASISTNLRLLGASGMVEHTTQPGDRRDYYHYPENIWGSRMEIGIESMAFIRLLAERGLLAIDASNTAGHAHLAEVVDFCDFAKEEYVGMIARWNARRAGRFSDPT